MTSMMTDLVGTEDADAAVRHLISLLRTLSPHEDYGLRGLFLYPRHGLREWHSNRFDPPGWRMYLIHTEEDAKSWFGVRDPVTGSIHHLPDFDGKANLFRIESKSQDAVWHSIYSTTNRWSCGVRLSDDVAQDIIRSARAATAFV